MVTQTMRQIVIHTELFTLCKNIHQSLSKLPYVAVKREQKGTDRCPEVYENGGCGQFAWENDRPVVPVVPAHGERKRGVDETFGKFDMPTRNRKVCDHFTK